MTVVTLQLITALVYQPRFFFLHSNDIISNLTGMIPSLRFIKSAQIRCWRFLNFMSVYNHNAMTACIINHFLQIQAKWSKTI